MPRKQRQVERLRFVTSALAPVVAHMDRLVGAGDGWINFVPVADDGDDRATALPFMTLLGGSGGGLTMITWIPLRRDRRGSSQSLGISHATGQRVVAALAAVDVPVPPAWTVEQDHPRRGLIVHPPADEGTGPVLDWALRAVKALDGTRPLTSWRADIHLPAT